jgi:glycosyltransferase involved in cell wall biosynthesis
MRVLILNPSIPDYRISIFNRLAEYFDLTVGHSGTEIKNNDLSFKQIVLPILSIGPISFYPINLNRLCKKFDLVISEGNIRYIDRDMLILNPFRRYKWITWGIGVSASYSKKFDIDHRYDLIRSFIFKKANAQIFYSAYPVKKYIRCGFKPESLFVANNTTAVEFDYNKKYAKFKLLFVGTLYRQKKIFDLLTAYLIYSKKHSNPLPLCIIGTGSEYENIVLWIKENNLRSLVKLEGAIFEQKLLEKHFRESYACISPGQAGLSVLTSMGYETPYITKKDAITGGEIFNILHNENGIIYNSDEDLVKILDDIHSNKSKYIQLGINARDHFVNHRLPKYMVQSIVDACKYVTVN